MHLAQPLLRAALDKRGPDGEKTLTADEAREILENAMRVLFYRDARSLNKVRGADPLLSAAARLARGRGSASLT